MGLIQTLLLLMKRFVFIFLSFGSNLLKSESCSSSFQICVNLPLLEATTQTRCLVGNWTRKEKCKLFLQTQPMWSSQQLQMFKVWTRIYDLWASWLLNTAQTPLGYFEVLSFPCSLASWAWLCLEKRAQMSVKLLLSFFNWEDGFEGNGEPSYWRCQN